MLSRVFPGVLIVMVVGAWEPAAAQGSMAPATEPEQWKGLSPDKRNRLRHQYLQSLSPRKREQLRTQVERFNRMSPEKQQELCRRFQKDRGYLPPACRKLF